MKNIRHFFDFLKVHNKLGEVVSRPLFPWRKSHLKKCGHNQTPLLGLNPTYRKYKDEVAIETFSQELQEHRVNLKLDNLF